MLYIFTTMVVARPTSFIFRFFGVNGGAWSWGATTVFGFDWTLADWTTLFGVANLCFDGIGVIFLGAGNWTTGISVAGSSSTFSLKFKARGWIKFSFWLTALDYYNKFDNIQGITKFVEFSNSQRISFLYLNTDFKI